MGSSSTLVCVKQVKQEVTEEWDESMPLPGDIIEGIAKDDADELFVLAKAKSEVSSQLGKISHQGEIVWLKVRRGDQTRKIRACIVPERSSMLKKKFTIKAANDDRHVAVLGDLTLEQCSELQEMSRRVVNEHCREFNKTGLKYDWKKKVNAYLPDHCTSVVSSIIFMPVQGEYHIDSTTARCMAWFSAAVSSGVPLVFVNVQTEQSVIPKNQQIGKDMIYGGQRNHNATVELMQVIRLWFLPGVAELVLEITPQPREVRFGMDLRRTEEGFVCVCSVAKDSAADRAGLSHLYEDASKAGYLLVISRIEGKSLMPSSVCAAGLIYCTDNEEIRDSLTSAIHQMDPIQVHLMAWPNQTHSPKNKPIVAATLQPPRVSHEQT